MKIKNKVSKRKLITKMQSITLINYSSLTILLLCSCATVKKSTEISDFSSWYGMYIKDEKVGYSEIKVEQKGEEYKIYELTYIELFMMGERRKLSSVSSYTTNPDFELQNWTFNLETEAQKIHSRGKADKNKLSITIKTGGKEHKKELNVKGKIYPITAIPMLANRFTKSGLEFNVFDPSIQAVTQAVGKLLEYEEDSIKVSVSMISGMSYAWVSKNGKLLSQNQPMGVVMKKEPKKIATNIGKSTPEILTLFSIKPELQIQNPRNVKLLKLLVNVDTTTMRSIPVSERQRWFGDTLLIEVRGPLKGKTIQEHLSATPFIQSDDEKIIKLAQKIVGEVHDHWKKVEKLAKWTAENIKDMPTVSIPSALDVLENMEGDCGEHTILFVALARAIGIPATEVVGLVYVENGFYYHAWAKVWVGRWVEVDPTFGQPIADATHIMLAKGGLEEQAKIMDIVDKIKIEVVKYK